jgi:hypothetical protein
VIFSDDRETFAAERSEALTEAAGLLTPSIRADLERWGGEDWFSRIVDAAVEVWRMTAEDQGSDIGVTDAFLTTLRDSLARTEEPTSPPSEVQVRRIADWLGTYVINATTMASAQAEDGDVLLEWVTMRDEDVRDLHRPLQGVQVAAGETFSVGQWDLQYPGQPVGDPEAWINCRCVVRPVQGEQMSADTFATEMEETILPETDDIPVPEDEIPPMMDWTTEMIPVPIHGVLIDTTEETGDGRHLAGDFDVLSVLDGPVPLRWVRNDVGQHDGAARVATIDETWRDGDRILYNGHLLMVPEVDDVFTLLAEGRMGLSVDLDSAVFEVDEDGDEPIMRYSQGRVRAATLVDIPALTGAWAELGSWDEIAMLASAGCEPCMERMMKYRTFAISEGEWDGSASRFSDEEWRRSAIVDRGESFETAKERYAMPIREPNGDLSRAGVHAAASRLNQVDAPEAAIASARKALVRAYGELDEEPPEALTAAAFAVNNIPEITKDAPGWITNPRETSRLRNYWAVGAGAAKIAWGTPGDFNRCRANLAEYVQRPDWLAGLCANIHFDALGFWPGQHRTRAASGLTASAFTIYKETNVALPAEWFTDPELTAPTPVTVTPEGRVFGHIAQWGVCHTGLGLSVGMDDSCTAAPNSPSNYAYYRTGVIDTDQGEIPVGNLTMGIGHAGERVTAGAAIAHYDNTQAVVADVVTGEDEHGIWFSGAMRSDLTEEQIRAFKASTLSGDWRQIGGEYELVAALAVNVPGFPIPRLALAASGGRLTALIAAGIIPREKKSVASMEVDVSINPDTVKGFVKAVRQEMAFQERTTKAKAKYRAKERARLAGRL